MAAVTTSGTAVVTLPADTQILITREFNAPRHLVFKAWTTPELIRRWWNADRGTVTIAVALFTRVNPLWAFAAAAVVGALGFV